MGRTRSPEVNEAIDPGIIWPEVEEHWDEARDRSTFDWGHTRPVARRRARAAAHLGLGLIPQLAHSSCGGGCAREPAIGGGATGARGRKWASSKNSARLAEGAVGGRSALAQTSGLLFLLHP